jgi:hypothetical protein
MSEEIFNFTRDGTKRAQQRAAFFKLVCLPRGHTDADFENVEGQARDNSRRELQMRKALGPVSPLRKRAVT